MIKYLSGRVEAVVVIAENGVPRYHQRPVRKDILKVFCELWITGIANAIVVKVIAYVDDEIDGVCCGCLCHLFGYGLFIDAGVAVIILARLDTYSTPIS
jgi:hypothetical protein